MKSKRIGRIEDLLVQETSSVIMNRLKDPRIGMVTIVAADVSPDIQNAIIYYSVMGGEREKEQAAAGLAHAASFIRRELAQVLTIKSMPRLQFVFDGSAEHAERLDMLIKGLSA
ncbi:MAG: ribosome-binding factor A [Candidatus Raymondbacteria bacterium RifOxyA12_full_50_37]|uniref:Ribosome-binding factor A n=1 Tax=Candidatus Raymondbacteria bacterium RIFOXYD12_FULL_49_13 TaxID=1817890 RepID=A0A1F7F0A0_UNCRA|nr:MAG: ribosome-binding factor A [Candidatus Raymondbacteria bacterium RifOxyA12_full_50_37]OGJ88792.1 MAG: ribosome-binding factor A [Candidatus Raymondbacteria bacterium RIFOXYA2_FULL_49_16]OGJ96551.1 MAG: ribosome-binding factor A [Candidatus Raymondbacteria bacterium RIFOXYC2_FULL_50_21]OGJ99161.1 MAG: ribosome-binding factor A [Candidatus Raymondbacteria bacterium RifOxyC12_full_50_8]OGJ99992.1 MAG: ribosome-binding factor A [Candidatus Raymondbacteria bacterium RIFOXYD12_FULL_49_13]OGP4